MTDELVLMTKTRQQILENRKRRKSESSKLFSLDTLSSNSLILSKCGGQTALVMRAVVASYSMAYPEHREAGFRIPTSVRKAISIGDRQYQRALQNLERAGYIERDIRPGTKARIRLTKKGISTLAIAPT